MFRQFAPIAALALTAAPLLPLNNNVAMAQPGTANAPQLIASNRKCVQIKLDRYEYRGERKGRRRYRGSRKLRQQRRALRLALRRAKRQAKQLGHVKYQKRVKVLTKKLAATRLPYRRYDKVYLDWHVDCYNQNNPPYIVKLTTYYGKKRYTTTFRGTASEYVFNVPKPRKYIGQKPTRFKAYIKVVGNRGHYDYQTGMKRF